MTTTDSITDGGPAFPRNEYGTAPEHLGMSLRAYLAGQAITGLLASPSWADNNISKPDDGTSLPEIAVEVADALIAELNKETLQ